jgi:hypothetical protein
LIVDGEKLVSNYLRHRTDVTALQTRIVGKTPNDTDRSWVRVTQLDAAQGQQDIADHLVEFYFQLDCFAGREGGQPEASLLARTIRAALTEIPAEHSEGIATGARINGSARIPDTDFEPARERFTITATVWAHT